MGRKVQEIGCLSTIQREIQAQNPDGGISLLVLI